MNRSFREVRSTPSVLRITYCVLLVMALALPALAQPQPIGHLIPIGGGYAEVYAGFVKEAIANAQNGQVNLLILPMAFATQAESISDTERAANTRDAEAYRFQIEDACRQAAPTRLTCTAILAPIFTHADANDPSIIKHFLS